MLLRELIHICDCQIITFGIGGLCLWFSNTSNVNSLDMFRKPFVDKFIIELRIFKNLSKENNDENTMFKLILSKIGDGWSNNMCLSIDF